MYRSYKGDLHRFMVILAPLHMVDFPVGKALCRDRLPELAEPAHNSHRLDQINGGRKARFERLGGCAWYQQSKYSGQMVCLYSDHVHRCIPGDWR